MFGLHHKDKFISTVLRIDRKDGVLGARMIWFNGKMIIITYMPKEAKK